MEIEWGFKLEWPRFLAVQRPVGGEKYALYFHGLRLRFDDL